MNRSRCELDAAPRSYNAALIGRLIVNNNAKKYGCLNILLSNLNLSIFLLSRTP